MPLYDLECARCHGQEERFIKLEDLQLPQLCDTCNGLMQRMISAPFVRSDLPGYFSPVSGKWIEGRAARREDLRNSGCVEWEAGFREESERRRRRADEAVEAAVEATVEAEIHAMPAKKRDKLVSELENTEVQLLRRAPA